jgi:hypothetical protein
MEEKMLNMKDIVETILKGWSNVSEFIYNTQDDENKHHFKPEYLITVKIAENIMQYFIDKHLLDQYSILLEEKTSKAITRREKEVLEYSKYRVPKKYRANKESKRKGRFDIVIYEKEYNYTLDSYRTICVIEIKNYYGYFTTIQRDISRINELIDNSIISNSFEFGIMTFIIKPAKKDWERLYSKDELTINKYMNNILKKLDLEDNWKVYNEIISKRYHDDDYPVLQYLYIVVVLIIV